MTEPVVVAEKLALRYPGGPPVMTDLGLKVERGEFVALLGRSGCGKTTLLRFLAGLFRAGEVVVAGSASVLGRNAASGKQLERGDVGFVFESPALLPWRTALENASLGLSTNRKSIAPDTAAGLFQAVGLAGYESFYPKKLSLGMQQRVALVRCLAYKPTVVFLDTPFSGVDSQTKLELMQLVSRLTADQTATVFVTHDVAEAVMLADRIIVLTPRPARAKATVEIRQERPRDVMTFRRSEDFARLERNLWSIVLEEHEES